jgi:lipopolysaccharide/colanic/teichoic acid biosynthesis glycosyltransferase
MRGTPFALLKYRTMRVDSHAVVRDDFKTVVEKDDPRITKIGRICRALGVDELPQLVNVLRGDMCWIGPRPDEAWMFSNYGPVIRRRVDVKPGITGLAQVLNGRDLATARSYAIDLWYVAHGTLALDCLIALLTPLFLIGFRSVARWKLDALLADREFQEAESLCASELRAATNTSQR